MFVGLLIVAAGAAGFGFALFGRRPIPQTATPVAGPERGPSADAPGGPVATRTRSRTSDVTLSRGVRVRSALLLALTVVGLAALIGGVLSVVVVGLVFVLT